MDQWFTILCIAAASLICVVMIGHYVRSRGRVRPLTMAALSTALFGLILCARFAMTTSDPADMWLIVCTALMMALLPIHVWQDLRREKVHFPTS